MSSLARVMKNKQCLLNRTWYSTVSALALPYRGISLPYQWLRDSCQCPRCVHPTTRQKLHRTPDILSDVQPTSDGIRYTDSGVHVTWASGHHSFYSNEFLALYSSPDKLQEYHGNVDAEIWDAEKLKKSANLYVPYESLASPLGLLTAITQLLQYGLLFVTGVPAERTSDQACEIRSLAQKFGELRSTFYGDVWNVKALRESRNVAYTDIFLGLHMDILYFEHPPRYQILHCLRNRVEGGTSMFVDAFHAASHLRTHHPEDFDVLTSTPVEFHYINDGHHLHRSHYTIQLSSIPSPGSSVPHSIQYVNYSPPFQAPLPPDTPPAFYPALARFTELLEAPSRRFDYLLKEGDAVIFDNRRVLHGRTEFKRRERHDSVQDDVADRWLKGCYFERDAMLDRWRILRQKVFH